MVIFLRVNVNDVCILYSSVMSGVVERSVTHNMSSKPETPRFHRPHHSIFSITRPHRQLVKAVKIWKMPFLTSSNFTKPKSFKERLRCVEMQRKASEASTAPKSISCSIRDLQLRSSDSSPSPFNSPLESRDTRRRRPVHTPHYRKQLLWYHTLSRHKRPKQHKLNLEVCDVFIHVCRKCQCLNNNPHSVFTGSEVTDGSQCHRSTAFFIVLLIHHWQCWA